MKCDWCETEFSPSKTWQRFCKPKCRDDWNNREKLRRQIEAAEERREDRINGANRREQKIDLAALGSASIPQVKRRAL